MIRRMLLVVAAAGLLAEATVAGSSAAAGLADLPTIAPIRACETLAGTDLNGVAETSTTITAATKIASRAGPFCRVLGTIAPAIRFELDMPVDGWQQRYLQTGCGGLCGRLNVTVSHAGTCAPALRAGLAVASDDMGHQSRRGPPAGNADGDFGNDPQKRIDFAYRANHATALVSKALIEAFYGRVPRHAYFSGCSDGGREALIEAERFPGDFDGIAAGAPAMNFQVQNSFYHAWQFRSNTGPDGKHILLAGKLPVLHRAALAACDAADGLKDGLIAEPRACHVDPAAVQCAAAATDTQDCLTAAEVEVARKLYAGPTDAAGHRFTLGGPQPGSELSWAGVYVPASAEGRVMSQMAAGAASQYLIFPEVSAAEGDIAKFAFTRDHFTRLAALHPLYDATDPDLAPFQKRGGKLILWHGWSDPHISPINTLAFHHAVGRTLGEKQRDSFVRLFLFPGMYHCDGGDGFSQFDVLTPLMAWVEGNSPPDKIIAAQVAQRSGEPPGDRDTAPGRSPGGAPTGAPPTAGPIGATGMAGPIGTPPMARPSGAQPMPGPTGTPPMAGPTGAPPPGAIAMLDPGHGPAPLPEEDAQPLRTRPVYPYPLVAEYSGHGSPDDAANFRAVPGAYRDPTDYEWEGRRFYAADSLRQYEVKDGKLVEYKPQ